MKKLLLVSAVFCSFFISCNKNKISETDASIEFKTVKSHTWYVFTETGFEKTDLPQNAKAVTEKPWTESVRISSAGSLVSSDKGSAKAPYDAYAIVNKKGLLAFKDDKIDFYKDESIFANDTADGLVYSGGMPVFYLFRSTFFNENLEAKNALHDARPFLVEFNPAAKVFYPLVSYQNLKLDNNHQISGFFWNGDTWACATKKMNGSGVEFSFFDWQPLVPLADLNPAMGEETFVFNSITEDDYKKKNMPKLMDSAPEELKKLISSIPQEYSFYVSWRDFSGTSPVSYCQMGTSDFMLNARGSVSAESSLSVLVFSDGTTYIKKLNEDNVSTAFRLPLLPSGFSYGEETVSGNTLYVAWEENSFFKTLRSGFIAVDLNSILQAN